MKNTVTIDFCGLNLEKTLNILTKNGVEVLGAVKIGKKTCKLTVYSANKRKTVAILKEKCYNITSIKDNGVVGVFKQARKHLAVVVMAALLVAVLAVASCFCLAVVVEGDETAVLQALADCGVGVGSFLPSVSVDEMENKLASALSVPYVVVEKRGATLRVRVVEGKAASPVDVKTPVDVVATESGVIRSLNVVCGTPLVKVGDHVEKGQTLIAAKRVFADGTEEKVRAIGEVWATVENSASKSFVAEEIYEPTGQTFRQVSVVLFNVYQTVPKQTGGKTACEKVVRLSPLVSVVSVTKEQMRATGVYTRFEDAVDDLRAAALEEATKSADFVVESAEYFESGNVVTATVRGKKKISGDSPLFGG